MIRDLSNWGIEKIITSAIVVTAPGRYITLYAARKDCRAGEFSGCCMATNRKKDAATLYEVLGRTAQKTPKKETPAAVPKPPTVESTPSMNNRTPLRIPATGSIRPPPTRASLFPAAVAAKTEAQIPASGSQSSPEPVLLDQILARFRPWILVVVAGFVALILAVVIIVSTSHHAAHKPLEPVTISPGTPTPGLVQPQLLPFNGNGSTPATGSSATPSKPPVPRVQVGQVVPASQVVRSPNRWYLVILTTLPRYAQHAAGFIAKHGVSVTIENGPQNFKCVISVRGFKHRAGAAAIALRRKVVHIGSLLPDARRAGRSDFNTAYYAHVQRSQ